MVILVGPSVGLLSMMKNVKVKEVLKIESYLRE